MARAGCIIFCGAWGPTPTRSTRFARRPSALPPGAEQRRRTASCWRASPMHHGDIVIKPRDVMPEGASTLPAEYYVSEEYYRREMEALFGRMWVHAGRAEDVAAPGQFVLRELLGESIVVTRSGSGAVNAFYNVCRHRGTRLCTETEGRFSGSIQCPYH